MQTGGGKGRGMRLLILFFFVFLNGKFCKKWKARKTSFHKISYKLRKIGGSIFSMIMFLLNGLRDVLLMV